jgi:hypothetical protein
MIEILVADFILALPEPHRVHYLTQIQVLLTDVEPQFVHYSLDFIFKLMSIVSGKEITLKDGVGKDLVPGYTVRLFQLQASSQKVLCFRRKVLPGDA